MTRPANHHPESTDTLDQVYRALSQPVRRQLLLTLQKGTPCTVEEIAAMQSGAENQAEDVVVKLHHVHLPLLDDAGFIEWDRESETITKGPQFEDLRPHLETSAEHLRTVDVDFSQIAIYRLLSHTHRRALIDCLDEHAVSLTLADAAEEVVRRIDDRPLRDIPAEEVKQVYMALYHTHVPKLTERNVVRYEQERDVLTLTDRGEQLATTLDRQSAPPRVATADPLTQ